MKSRIDNVIIANSQKKFDVLVVEKAKHEEYFDKCKTPRDLAQKLQLRINYINPNVFHDDYPEVLQIMTPKMICPISDSDVKNCYKCKSVFYTLLRKHHCRCCGRIFCYSCSSNIDYIPKNLYLYHTNDKFYNDRTCDYCNKLIKLYVNFKKYIKYFQIMNLTLDKMFKAHVILREAAEFYINDFRTIQYYKINESIKKRHMDMLIKNKDFLSGHSVWSIQLARFGIKHNENKIIPCHILGCNSTCSIEISYFDRLIANKNISSLSKLGFSEEVYSLIEQIKSDRKIKVDNVPYIGPFGVIKELDNKIINKASITKPKILRYIDDNNQKKAFMYKQDNVNNDYYITNLIKLLYNIIINNFSEEDEFIKDSGIWSVLDLKPKFNFPELISYGIRPIDSNSGFIEMVTDAKTIESVLCKGTISNYLYTKNKKIEAGQICYNYTFSLSFWIAVTYILGIGDRHRENIMVHSNGTLFHIDYGFVMYNDAYVPAIRLDSDMIEGIGGHTEYESFKLRTLKIFLILRDYYNLIYTFMNHLDKLDTEIFISKRLMIGYSDIEVKEHFLETLESSNKILVKMNDVIHSTVSSIRSWNMINK